MNSALPLHLHKFLPTKSWNPKSSSHYYLFKKRCPKTPTLKLRPYPRRTFASAALFSSSQSNNHNNGVTADGSASIHRKVIWFHHIKSSKKKKHIVEWSKELRLGGYCKPGFPGVLIYEGEGENVADYLKRLKRLRWQHIQVRGEEEEQLPPSTKDQSVDSLRRFSLGIRELPESGMSELAEKCREANLESLFLTALKISR